MIVRPAGARAVLLDLDGPDEVRAWSAALASRVAAGDLTAPTDTVLGARTLLLDGVDPEAVRRTLALVGRPEEVSAASSSQVVEVPVSYDGADLGEVARLWGTTPREVVARHTGAEFTVAFCGFAPGFPYLLGLPGDEVPRRTTPRPSVPAGSVGLAGRYCGIYPSSSPGGWQLLGRTEIALFDADRDPPALLPPGTRVRFVEAPHPVAADRAVQGRRDGPADARGDSPEGVPDGAPNLTVIRAGALTTVQDRGRTGRAHLGVPRAGPLDAPAAELANRLVGNDPDAAVLETTLDGVGLRASRRVTVAVTGGQGAITVDGGPSRWGVALDIPAGAVLDVGPAAIGVRSYVAVAGGLATATTLGSRSSDTLAGLGPRPLRAGDVLPVGDAVEAPPPVEFSVPPLNPALLRLRLVPGPRDDWFGAGGLAAMNAATYEVSPLSNRVGSRLSGPPVPRLVHDELESEGIVLGAVQVPPDGQPVVLLADHPTTGGYPVIGVVHPSDLPALAQARPGTLVRFTTSARR